MNIKSQFLIDLEKIQKISIYKYEYNKLTEINVYFSYIVNLNLKTIFWHIFISDLMLFIFINIK